MKKTLFSLFAALALCACESSVDAPCPVTGIELPASSASAPVMPGETVTIRGVGFEPDCTVALHSGATSVQAEVLEVTASALSFRAPILSGRQQVVLSQSGGSWTLGELVFPRPEELPLDILPRRISHIRVTLTEEMSYTLRYTYDEADRIIEIRETDLQYIYEGAPADQVWEDAVRTVAYAENRITVTGPYGSEIIELTDGRATMISADSDQKHSTFSYDDKGYLAQSTFSSSYGDAYQTTYTIIDGSLVEYTTEDGQEAPVKISFENDPSRLNNLNLDLFGTSVLYDGDADFYTNCLFNINGKRFRTLPIRVIIQEDGDSYISTYRYTTQGDYLSRIDIYNDDRGRQELTCTLEIFYEE